MSDVVDYTEVPYLQEILNYLPIDPADEEDVINYIQNITNLIAVNYKYGQYQFAYFGLHLLYMTFIYCTAWKIGQIEPVRYKDAIVFARSYNGRERDLKIEDADSIFSYNILHFSELFFRNGQHLHNACGRSVPADKIQHGPLCRGRDQHSCVNRLLKHYKAVFYKQLPELTVISFILVCFRGQIKKHKRSHKPVTHIIP